MVWSPRLLWFAPEIDSWDAVDFARALDRYDLLAYQPHFPGYPVYVALGKLARLLGASDATALTLPGLLLFGLAAALARRALARWHGARAGWALVLLLAVAPGLLLTTLRPISEGVGLSLVLASVSCWALGMGNLTPSGPRWAMASGVLLGLALGARLSYFPLALSGLWLAWRTPGPRRPWLLGAGIGIALWSLPFALVVGPSTLWEEGLRFTGGHFTRWGGAVGAESEFGSRGLALWFGMYAYGLGGYWPPDGATWTRAAASLGAVLLLTGALWGCRRWSTARIVLWIGLPYALWATLAQNPDSPRHLAPLWCGLFAAGAVGLPRVASAAALLLALVGLPTAQENARTPAPQAALARFLAQQEAPARFYGWKTTRVLAYYAPQHDARLAFSLAKMAQELARDPAPGPVYFESMLRERRRRDRCFLAVATFRRSRFLEPTYHKLALFQDCGPP